MNSNSISAFRDPCGFVVKLEKEIYRCAYKESEQLVFSLVEAPFFQTLLERKKVVSTSVLASNQSPAFQDNVSIPHSFLNKIGLTISHEAISFPSYPYEWTWGMLQAAGFLTLEIAEKALEANWGLKDASPYNVLFKGSVPIFVDILSFEKRDPLDPIWLPYAQFLRTFILPLLAIKSFGLSLKQIFCCSRDGLEPHDLYSMTGGLRRWIPPYLSLVTLPCVLARWADKKEQNPSLYRPMRWRNSKQVRFVLKAMLAKLRKKLAALAPKEKASNWSDYMVGTKSYSQEQYRVKCRFVEQIILEKSPQRVLDIGCNNGTFSLLCAKKGADVVAIDTDDAALGNLWKEASREGLSILPLNVDIARPSPGMGWNNSEHRPFLERAEGHFDLVLMLAIVHHLIVQERIPLEHIAALASRLTTDLLIVEFISPKDPMFRKIARGRDELYEHICEEYFEKAFGEFFSIQNKVKIADSSRTLYLLKSTVNHDEQR